MEALASILWCPIIIIVFLAMVLLIRWQVKRYRLIEARIQEIQKSEGTLAFLKPWDLRYQYELLTNRTIRTGRVYLAVSPKRLTFYERNVRVPEIISFSVDQIRWFGRPEKYTPGTNEIWLHLESEEGWSLLKIWLHTESMRDLVRALKAVTPPELVTAYRRRRPYIHSGPFKAYPASQDIHGAWTLDEQVDLYLMPRYLVFLAGEKLLRKVPLEAVQQIGALRRIDQPQADGLVRFRAEEETMAFGLPQYEAFAQALAEAAKRTLEAPMMQKQKGKEDDEWDE